MYIVFTCATIFNDQHDGGEQRFAKQKSTPLIHNVGDFCDENAMERFDFFFTRFNARFNDIRLLTAMSALFSVFSIHRTTDRRAGGMGFDVKCARYLHARCEQRECVCLRSSEIMSTSNAG